MDRELLQHAEKYRKRRQRKSVWKNIMSVLGGVMVFCVTYALILPAITQAKDVFCGKEEHIHDDSCYVQRADAVRSVLACSYDTLAVHTHDAGCYDAAGRVLCGQADYVVHTHEAGCFDETGNLMCAIPERTQHTHTDACYEVQGGHTHSDGCYEETAGELVCTIPETPGHVHEGDCYAVGKLICTEVAEEHEHTEACYEQVLQCEIPESEGHTHTQQCYEVTTVLTCTVPEVPGQQVLVCTEPEAQTHVHSDVCLQAVTEDSLTCALPEDENHQHGSRCYGVWELVCELEEHRHVLICTANPNADLETPAIWGESFEKAKLTGIWAEDILAIAETQLGYEESTKNFIVLEDGETVKGYTRYGAWYGDHYGDWCAMFVSFCLNYSNIPQEAIPYEASCPRWVQALQDPEVDLYRPAEEYTPVPGDIIFFDWEEDGSSDHVGIVKETDPKKGTITTVEGNSGNAVAENEYQLDDPAILGYAQLPAQVLKAPEAESAATNSQNQTAAVSDAAPAENVYYCGMTAHEHTSGCYDVYGNQICVIPEHVHDAACEVETVYYCGKEAHTHDSTCPVDCTIEEHTHDAACRMAPEYYCGLENDPSHTHVDACLISPYRCGLVKHLHDENCPDDCAIIEHIHTDGCKEEPTYQCGLEEHQHSDSCYDADGNLTCEKTVHTHTDDCLLIYYCGIVNEHVHSGCYVNFVHTCGIIGHEHFYLCTMKPMHCGYEHTHNAACFDEKGILTCTEHTHVLSCWINPASSGTNTDPEGTFAGSDRFHSSYFQKYQDSSHTISSYEVGVFALIPESANVDGWVPNTRQWSGDSNANYLVAYCSDDRTTSSKKGEGYETYTLNTSRFTDDEQRRKVAAIIGHSYPFLTAEEMRQQLEYAYEQGLTVSSEGVVIDIRDSVESDWIAATQWALWDTTTTMEHHPTNEVDIDDYGNDRPAAFPTQYERRCINPLTDPGYTDIEESRQKLEAIHNWLMNLQEPEALTVKNYTYQITENPDGTYKLTVDVILNRETVYGEHTVFQLSVGNKATAINELQPGTGAFQLILDGITLEEIANAHVYLNVDGKHMQAYFFDSFNYQDMVGGNWEYYSEDLSFNVAADVTDVTVYKKWAEGVPADIDSVTVQLYADGKAYGDAVELSEANGWTYTWKNLNKCHISGVQDDGTVFGGEEIVYTIVETPVPGYYSSLTQVEGFDGAVEEEPPVTITYWKEVKEFTGDGEYVLLSDVGALTASYFKNKYYMNVSPIDLSVVTEAQAPSVWTAAGSAETGYKLASKQYPNAYMGDEVVTSESGAESYFVKDGLLYFTYTSSYSGNQTNYYFRSFYSNGYQVYDTNPSLAMHFRLYKLTTETLQGSEINFLLTNSKVPEEVTASVTITKKWEGRRDENYPLSATVTLLQNGRPYGSPVTLNGANSWTYTWDNLPYSMNGELVDYSVEEVPIPGYESTFEIQDNMNTDDRALILTLTNKWKPSKIPVEVKKADVLFPSKLLPGAQFDVYAVDSVAADRQQIPGTDYTGILQTQLTIPQTGTVWEFEAGEIYCLVETVAPDGYNLLTETLVIRVTEDVIEVLSGDDWLRPADHTLTITNKPGFNLPETGGNGTILYTLGGLLLITAAAILLLYRPEKRGRRRGMPS